MKRTTPDVIAIDGPAASGKSTVARLLAEKTKRIYVDSGSFYRAITWLGLNRKITEFNPEKVIQLANEFNPDFFIDGAALKFRIDGKEPGEALRTSAVNRFVSPVATVPEARRKVVALLRCLTRFGPLVMEGRDIGTAVFPDAPWKFYLDASPEERARRRHAEASEANLSLEEVSRSIKRRDIIDSGRRKDPLRVAHDAAIIDTTNLAIDEVVEIIARRTASS